MNFQDLISIFYVLISIKVITEIIRNRSSLFDDYVSTYDRRLVTQAAFFFLIPFGVLLHELGHAVATWYFGGEVIEFEWRIFWGYVLPEGDFSQVQRWWISVSGNLVSVVYGLLPIPFIRYVRKGIYKEFLKSFVKIELIYSLICYPMFSVVEVGDWVRIYDFSITPYSQITLLAHIILLVVLWRSWVFSERLA